MAPDLSGFTLFDPARDSGGGRETRYVSPAQRAERAKNLSTQLAPEVDSKASQRAKEDTTTTASVTDISAAMKASAKIGSGVELQTDFRSVHDRALVYADVVKAMREAAGDSPNRALAGVRAAA